VKAPVGRKTDWGFSHLPTLYLLNTCGKLVGAFCHKKVLQAELTMLPSYIELLHGFSKVRRDRDHERSRSNRLRGSTSRV